MKLNELALRAHTMAVEKGFYDTTRSPLDYHMLIVSEIAEATEAVRNNEPDYYENDKGKPEGEPVELADAVIRIADYFQFKGWNLEDVIKKKMEYNSTRGYRHGNKKY